MDQQYTGEQVNFRYPADWQLLEEDRSGEKSLTLTGPGTVFWSLTLLPQRLDPGDVLQAALAAFREDYPELDIYGSPSVEDKAAEQTAEVGFMCLELTNSAFLKSFRTEELTALVLYQATDSELEQFREELEAITRSLTWRGDRASRTA